MRIIRAFIGLLILASIIVPTANANVYNETIQFTLSDGSTPRDNNIFVQGSYLRVYIHTPFLYNFNRIVAYDYLFVIKDPKDNRVHLKMLENRSRSYVKESSVHFSKLIPQEWIDGEYTVEIFIMDRVDHTYTDKRFVKPFDPRLSDDQISDMDDFFTGADEDILIDEGLMIERSDALVIKKELKFIIDSSAKPYFIRSIDVPESVPPESSVNVIVTLENTQEDKIKESLTPVLNGKSIAPVNFELSSQGTKTIEFEIPQSRPGENILNIGSKTVRYKVDEIPLQPTEFIYEELRIDRTKILKGNEFNVSVGVFNIGQNGTLPVVLILNDQIEATENVSLEYGGSKMVKFNLTLDTPGIYQAKIKGKDFMKIIVIQDKDAEDNSKKSNGDEGPSIPFISGLEVLIIFCLSGYYLKRHT